jgi:YidC/Oxa1 family membrane protein insertase
MIELWNSILLEPMLNFMILLSNVFFNNFAIAIIVLTVIVRLLMFPLTMRQLHSTKAMSALQPKLKELQKKYGKDKRRLQQEMAKLYRESGVNPLGCLWPMLIQLPIWIALYQSILKAVAASPEDLFGLSDKLYGLSMLHEAVPLESGFLWLNLGSPDPFLIMAILVGGTMYIQQKMAMVPTTDPKQQSMNRMMLWMMPLLFAFFTLQFPSGLALFWVVSNIIGIVMQYFVTGWGSLDQTVSRLRGRFVPVPVTTQPVPAATEVVEPGSELVTGEVIPEEGADYGKPRDKRKDHRRGRRTRPKRTGRRP